MTGNLRQLEEFMKIGYVRVSKQEQNEALQIDALKAAGCEKWFVDKITGSKVYLDIVTDLRIGPST